MKRVFIVALLIAASCGGRAPRRSQSPTPDRRGHLSSTGQAKEILANAPELGEYEFTNAAATLPMKKSQMNAPAQDLAKSLRAAGWITINGDDVALTSKAKEDKRFLVRANGFVDIVPLAKKEFGDVTSVNQDTAHFTWRWVRNDIGSAIKKPDDAEQHAVAKFIYDGKAWSVLSITPE